MDADACRAVDEVLARVAADMASRIPGAAPPECRDGSLDDKRQASPAAMFAINTGIV